MYDKYQLNDSTASTESTVKTTIVPTWQAQIAQMAHKKTALANLFAPRRHMCYNRFGALCRQSMSLSDGQRRKLFRCLGTSMAGATLALALTQAPVQADSSCVLAATGDISHGTANLGPLQNDTPGSPATHALLISSQAINAGNCSGGTVTTDQRGVSRPQGVACDIGAFEVRVINSSITQQSVTTTYYATAQSCGTAGNLPYQVISPKLLNKTSTTFSNLFFIVKTLEYTANQSSQTPKLCNADIPGGGVGATFTMTGSLAGNSNITPAFQVGCL